MLKVLLKLYSCTWQSKRACLKTYLWLREQRWSEGGGLVTLTLRKSWKIYFGQKRKKKIQFLSSAFWNESVDVPWQNYSKHLGRLHARHVVSHFSYMSSNKLKWGAISSWLISAELGLFHQPPSGVGGPQQNELFGWSDWGTLEVVWTGMDRYKLDGGRWALTRKEGRDMRKPRRAMTPIQDAFAHPTQCWLMVTDTAFPPSWKRTKWMIVVTQLPPLVL